MVWAAARTSDYPGFQLVATGWSGDLQKAEMSSCPARKSPARAFSNFCESRDFLGAANKILWPSQAEEAAMGYSNDLRVRVIRVIEGGIAARAAARQFVIGDATAIRWVKRWRETGSFEARSVRGQSRSPLKKHEDWLLALFGRNPI